METIKELHDKFVHYDVMKKNCIDEAKEQVFELLNKPEFNFHQFKLDVSCMENLVKCAITGKAHDWSATYPEDPRCPLKRIDCFAFAKHDDMLCIYVELTYKDGSYNFGNIPLDVFESYDTFSKWYELQETIYKHNRTVIAQLVRHRENLSKQEAFKQWLESGREYFQNGLVRMVNHNDNF